MDQNDSIDTMLQKTSISNKCGSYNFLDSEK